MDARSARTRTAALHAARELMLEDGLDAITHAHVARRAQLGRRTLYRHWATRHDLLHDTLAGASFPVGEPTGDLRTDVRRHLEQLRTALVDGPLAAIVLALGERSRTDPDLALLRARLVAQGCAPLRQLLQTAHDRAGRSSSSAVDVQVAELEGPLFYTVCVQGLPPDDALIDDLVDRVLFTASRPSR